MKTRIMILVSLLLIGLTGFSQDFKCGDPFTDIRDNQVYPTVQVGAKCWMAKNLNYGVKVDYPINQTILNGIPSKWCYANKESNCATYGAVYQWDILMNNSTVEGSQGICPEGWHVATFDEFEAVINANGGYDLAGASMHAAGTQWYNPIKNAYGTSFSWQKPLAWKPNNSTGLTVLGNGMLGGWAGSGYDLNKGSGIYTSSMKRTIDLPAYAGQPYDATLYPAKFVSKWYSPKVTLMVSYKGNANAARCVKD